MVCKTSSYLYDLTCCLSCTEKETVALCRGLYCKPVWSFVFSFWFWTQWKCDVYMYSFSKYFPFFFLLLLFFYFLLAFSSNDTPILPAHILHPDLCSFSQISNFVCLFHCIKVQTWPRQLHGHMIRVGRDSLAVVGSALLWLPAFKEVILKK